MLVTDKQGSVALEYNQSTYSFTHNGKVHKSANLDKVHQYFRQNTPFDTIKFTCNREKHYAHFWDKDVEVYSTKKALRRTLSHEGGGTWIEEKADKKRHFVEEKGWLSSTFKEVSAEDCVENPSVWQKVFGLGLGILALAPGVSEFARRVSVSKEVAGFGFLAIQPKNPLSGLLTLSMVPSEVYAQAVGTEFQVNTNGTGTQARSSVASLSNGGFVVIWRDLYDIVGKRYENSGLSSGGEFQIGRDDFGQDATLHQVAGHSNGGGFVVVWGTIDTISPGSYGVFARRYDSNGSVGAEFQVNTYTIGTQNRPRVATLNTGEFVVVWESGNQDGPTSASIYGQRYNSSGLKEGMEFRINTYSSNSQQSTASVASLTNGGYVVVWQSDGQDGDLWGIYGQRYDANGTSNGMEFQVNNYTTSFQENPGVASLSNGEFVVVWQSGGQDGDSYGIFGQKYNNSGGSIGGEFQINTNTTSGQLNPSVTGLNDGGFVVVWQSDGQDGDQYGVFGQRYDSNGSRVDLEFQVNTYTTNFQQDPSVAGLNDGGFIVTWSSWGQDGDRWGIYGQRYNALGMVVGPLSSTEVSMSLPTQVSTISPTPFFTQASTSSPIQPPSRVSTSSTIQAPSRVSTMTPTPFFTQISTMTPTPFFTQVSTSSPIQAPSRVSTMSPTLAPSRVSTMLPPPTTSSNQNVGNEDASEEPGFPAWAWGILGAGAAACVGLVAFIGYKLRGKKKEDEEIKLDSKSSSSIDPNPPSNTSSVNLETFPGTLVGTYYQAIETSKKGHSQYVPFPKAIPLREEAYTRIGGKYDLLTKINRKEAESLYYQTGIAIQFPEGKNKTKALLGDGNFSKVRIAKFANKKVFVAVKKIKGKKEIKASRQEGKLQKKFESQPNILPVYDVIETTDSQDQPVLYQFMMLAGFGDGESFRDRIHTSGFSPKVVQKILVDVAQGLLTGLFHMHEKKIYHLDFKPGNILFNMAGEAYVSDFGCAKEIPSGQIQEVMQGDSQYFSPERLAFYRRYSNQELPDPISAATQDAWALGVCLLELMGGAYPFEQTTDWRQSIARDAVYFEKKLAKIPELQNPASGSLADVVKRLLNVDPKSRLDIDEALGEMNQIETFSGPKERAKLFAAMKGLEIVDPEN